MLLLSRSHDPYLNLAIEDGLFRNYNISEPILYLWVNSPSVIVGQNQNIWKECRLEKMKTDGIFPVRRQSGGGAVYHDLGNLLFSFIMKDGENADDFSYGVVLEALRLLGIDAERHGRNDIEVNGKKISGSAYMHSKGAFLHHGTLLVSSDQEKLQEYLQPSKLKLSAKGIDSVRKRVMNLSEIMDVGVDDVIAALCKSFAGGKTPLDALEFADKAHVEKVYDYLKSDAFIYGATPAFDVQLELKTSKGEYQILLSVKYGKVISAKIYTDSLDLNIACNLEPRLLDIPFDKKMLASAIKNIAPELSDEILKIEI